MKLNQEAFTIIELLIATVVFTVILTLTTTSIIGISNTYVKGSVQNQTQQSARAILSDITQDIQYNSTPILAGLNATSGNYYYFCIGNDVYAFQLDQYLSASKTGPEYSPWGLVRYSSTDCPSNTDSTNLPPGNPLNQPGAEELLAFNERLGQLNITPIPNLPQPAYKVDIEVGYGEDDLLDDSSTTNAPYFLHNGTGTLPPTTYQYKYQCQSGSDSSFCAVSSLTTVIAQRISN